MFSEHKDQDFLDSLFSGRRDYSEDRGQPHNLPVLKSTLADKIRVKVKNGNKKKKKKLIIASSNIARSNNAFDDYNDDNNNHSKSRANGDNRYIDYNGYENNKNNSNVYQQNQFARSTQNDSRNDQLVSNRYTQKNERTNLGYISNFLRSVKGDSFSGKDDYPESDRSRADNEIRNDRVTKNSNYNDYDVGNKDNKSKDYDYSKTNNDYNRSSTSSTHKDNTNNTKHGKDVDKSNINSSRELVHTTQVNETGDDNQINIKLFMDAWKEIWILQIRVRGMLFSRNLQIKRKVYEAFHMNIWRSVRYRDFQTAMNNKRLITVFSSWIKYLKWCRKFNTIYIKSNTNWLLFFFSKLKYHTISCDSTRTFRRNVGLLYCRVAFRCIQNSIVLNRYIFAVLISFYSLLSLSKCFMYIEYRFCNISRCNLFN
jgi:hypothetical protein